MRAVNLYTTEGAEGQRLDRFVAAQLGRSRARAQALIAAGAVSIEPLPKSIEASYKLRAGDAVTVTDTPEPEAMDAQPEDIPLTILHEDDALIVLNKPPGLVVHPGAGHATGTLVNALLHHCGGKLSRHGGAERLGIVHRLDKDTSGLMVVAKTDDAHEALAAQFAARTIGKAYLAMAKGVFRQPRGSCRRPIGRHKVHRQKMTVQGRGGRDAHTDYHVQKQWSVAARVECILHTGRTHQIRVHLADLGHPILGDSVYGRALQFPSTMQPPARQLLHAAQLAFDHPVRGGRLAFTAPLPEDFTSFQDALDKLESSS